MTEAEKLQAIQKLAEDVSTQADEYAVGLAADVLAVLDGTVSEEEILQCCNWPVRTVGDALAAAKVSVMPAPGSPDCGDRMEVTLPTKGNPAPMPEWVIGSLD